MYHAYLDESGTVAPFDPSDYFLVVAIIAVEQNATRSLELHIKRLRKRLGKQARDELKARTTAPEDRLWLLQAVAGEDVWIVAIILDKRDVRSLPNDPEDWYREAAGLAVRHCAQRWPELRVALDQRYTNRRLREKLDRAIRERLCDVAGANVALRHLDSQASRALQVADYVAWAIRRKYEAGDSEGYEAIRGRIVLEKVIRAQGKRASP